MKDFTPLYRRAAVFLCSAAPLILSPCAVSTIFSTSAAAQSAHFNGAQSIVTTGLSYPNSVAVDAIGNVYVVDPGHNRVLRETPAPGGYTQTIVASGVTSPGPAAVDLAGNVYIVDYTNGRILKETPSTGNYIQTVIVTGLLEPSGIAVDTAGNVYISDTGHQVILKETLFGTAYIKSIVCYGVDNPRGLAVDASGNLYIADQSSNHVWKETASGGGYTRTSIGSGLYGLYGVAVDAAGNVYIADTGNARILRETLANGAYTQTQVVTATPLNSPDDPTDGPEAVAVDPSGNLLITDSVNNQILKLWKSSPDFGQVNAGSTSQPISLMFTFDGAGTLGSITSLTQGSAAMDFTVAGTGSCTAGSFYFIGANCTVDATFTPKLAGNREGALLLRTSAAHTFVTSYMHGMGLGAQTAFLPGAQRVVPFVSSGQSSPYGVAVDGNGNVFIADADNNRVLKESWSRGGIYTETVVGSGLQSPTGLAVDAAGNLYIADTYNSRVVKETPYLRGYSQSIIGSGLEFPYGVAVGADGSVYISDTMHGRVVKETPSASSYVQSTLPTSGLGSPYGIAVDASGTVYIGDVSNQSILKETFNGGVYAQSVVRNGIAGPYGLAVDAVGSVYVTVFNSGKVYKYRVSGTTYSGTTLPASGLANPYAVAVDGKGNVYIADVGNEQVYEEDFADLPNLAFANTPVGSTSSDSPRVVTLENFGNLPLNFPVPMTGSNPSIAPNFTLGANSCPVAMAGSGNPEALPAGQTCSLPISFTPLAAGALSGSLVLTDDALNPFAPGGSTQTIALAGTATQVTTTITWASPVPITYGTPLGATQLNAVAMAGAVTVGGTYVYTPAGGKVLAPGSNPLSVVFTPTNVAEYVGSTANASIAVQKAVLKVTATNASKVYGAANPAFTYTITGFVNGDTAAGAVTGTALLSTSALTSSPAGAYPISATAGTLASTKYTFQFVAGTLTVSKASLSVSATSASVAYNKALPVFAYTVTGFVNGDTKTAVTGAPVEGTTAVAGSAPGTYPITLTQGTLAASDYSFTFTNGTLTVTPLGTAATPTFTPMGGAYAVAQNVTIADTTAGAAIYYTTNGTAPTITSTKYTAAIKVTATETIKAIAVAPGYTQSAVATAAYTIN